MSSTSETHVSFSKDQQITVLQETVVSTRGKFSAQFDHVDEHYINNMTIDGFLEYIERQRLTHMPHRGSRWDKVLKWAEFFGLQISGYAKAVEAFVPDSKLAAKLIWAACRTLLEVCQMKATFSLRLEVHLDRKLLLVTGSGFANSQQLGPDNAKALEVTFGVFYELGLSLSLLLRHNKLLFANNHIRTEVGQAFNGLLILIRDVSMHYHAVVNGMLSSETSLDFGSLFGRQITGFQSRQKHIVDAMWKDQLGEQESMDIATLRSWLGPRDSTLKKLYKNRVLSLEHRDEYTCEWFQRHLLDFSRSKDDLLALFGREGCGKTYLSRWIVERLQRPLAKKTCKFYVSERR